MAKERPRDAQEKEPKETGEERSPARRESALRATAMPFASPFSLMGRFMEDLDRIFEVFGAGPGLTPRIDLPSRAGEGRETMWVPPVEVSERDGQLVIRADVPGLTKDQVNVEIEDGQLIISGERRQEHEERRGGFFRSERTYGSFYRAVPLPEGVNPEQAKATFKDGVLEITMPAPPRPQARRVEIQEGAEAKPTQQPKSA